MSPHAIKQLIKWTVYSLLIVNFIFYVLEDWEVAQHTLRAGGTWIDWTTSFAASIDEVAWFLLLGLFELETYALSDKAFTPLTEKLIHGVRIICYVSLAHTIYAYSLAVADLYPAEPVAGVEQLCDLKDGEVSYTYNYEYTLITADNCQELSDGNVFFYEGDTESVVTDPSGLNIARNLAWVDLVEATVWLLIVLLIELVVRLQERGITGGAVVRSARGANALLYGILLLAAAYWATLSHWLYVWDELLWIGGFMAIEMNIGEWRDEIATEEANA